MTTIWVREDGHAGWGFGDVKDLSHIHHTTTDLAGWISNVVIARASA
jgi:hypothetical protein